MRELAAGKTLKVAPVKEDDKKNKKDKADKKEKKDRKDPPEPPTVAPSKGEKGDKGGKSGKGASKGDHNQQRKGEHPRDPSKVNPPVYHCYWFHHPKGCQRTECRFKQDKKISQKEKQELLALNLEKRSASAPPRPSDNAKEIRKACYEFKKSGTCKKGADCSYEHVAAAP